MTTQWQWKHIRSESGPALKLFNVRYDWMQHPLTGVVEKMTVLESRDSVNVLAFDESAQLLMVQQYRFGIGAETLELPGGIVDEGEDSRTAATRELREETGYTATDWQYLGKTASNPVFMDSYIHHWLARDARPTHEPQWDAGEAIAVVQLSLARVKAGLKTGRFEHPHTVAALVRGLGEWLLMG